MRLVDVGNNELPVESVGNYLSRRDHRLYIGPRRDADEDPFVGSQVLCNSMLRQVLLELVVHHVRGQHQRQFTESRELLPSSSFTGQALTRALNRFAGRGV